MARLKFEIDDTNLDKSAAEALRAHMAGQLSYSAWKVTAARIHRLQGIEAFRQRHAEALRTTQHPEHETRAAELQGMFEATYPDEPAAVS